MRIGVAGKRVGLAAMRLELAGGGLISHYHYQKQF